MIKLTIDGVEAEVSEGLSIAGACEAAGRPLPNVCRRAEETLPGVLRLSFVEIRGRDGVFDARTEKAADGMEIATDTPRLKKMRERAVRLMLAKHPPECSVCEKAGECLLQDVCFELGLSSGDEGAVTPLAETEETGPLVRMHSGRCILCMECLRFMRDVAGTSELALSGKGAETRIVPFVNGAFSSPLSGNLTDICPAGAFTDGSSKFLTRPWNVERKKTIDVLDSFLPPVFMDVADGRIVRVTPAPLPDGRAGMISDRTRFGVDGTAFGRVDRPYIRVDGRFRECSWTEALMTAASKLKEAAPSRTAAFVGSTADCESMAALADMMKIVGSANVDAGRFYARVPKRAGRWRFCNTAAEDVAKADALLIVGADPEREASLMNAAIRGNPMPKALLGARAEQNYACEYLGDSSDVLNELASGRHPFASVMKRARFPMLVAGKSLWRRSDARAVFEKLYETCVSFGVVKDGWNGFNMVGVSAGMLGASELGLVAETPLLPKAEEGAYDVLYLLGEDRLTRADTGGAFVIYQGTFASETAMCADVILPGAAYTEKRATYVGSNGTAKSTAPVLPPPGQAREDWKILRALSEYLEKTLPYDDLDGIRDRLGALSAAFVGGSENGRTLLEPVSKGGNLSDEPFSLSGEGDDNEVCRRSPSLRSLKKIRKENNG